MNRSYWQKHREQFKGQHRLSTLTFRVWANPHKAWIARCNCGTSMKARRSRANAIESLVQHVSDCNGPYQPFNDVMYQDLNRLVRW